MRVRVPEVLDHTLGPLETLLTERTPRVQRHHCAKVLQFLAFLRCELITNKSLDFSEISTMLTNTRLRKVLSLIYDLCKIELLARLVAIC